MRLLAVWLINAVALLALPYLLPSIHVESFATALWVAVGSLALRERPMPHRSIGVRANSSTLFGSDGDRDGS